MRGEQGYCQHISEFVNQETLGYGPGKLARSVELPRFARIPYSHAGVWSVSPFLAPLIAAGVVLAGVAIASAVLPGWVLRV